MLPAPGGHSPEGERRGDTRGAVGEHVLGGVPEPDRFDPLPFVGFAGKPAERLPDSLRVRLVNPFLVAIVASRWAEDVVGQGHPGSAASHQARELDADSPPAPLPSLRIACPFMENGIRDGRVAEDGVQLTLGPIAHHRIGDAESHQARYPRVNRVGAGPGRTPSVPQSLLVVVVLRSVVDQRLVEVEHERVERLASPLSHPITVGEADVLVDADARHGPREREVDNRPAETCAPDDPVDGPERLPRGEDIVDHQQNVDIFQPLGPIEPESGDVHRDGARAALVRAPLRLASDEAARKVDASVVCPYQNAT